MKLKLSLKSLNANKTWRANVRRRQPRYVRFAHSSSNHYGPRLMNTLGVDQKILNATLIAVLFVAVGGFALIALRNPKGGLQSTQLIFGAIGWIAFDYYDFRLAERGSIWKTLGSFLRTATKMILVSFSADVGIFGTQVLEVDQIHKFIGLVLFEFILLVGIRIAATR